jgi:predicted glycosyltransferase
VTRPRLILYCQHSVGMGHLVRSLTLADALSDRFDVVLLSGGAVPPELTVPPAVRVVPLPPLGHDDGYELVSRDPHRSLEVVKRARARRVLSELRAVRPAAVIVELYPFGRRKFAFELLPLLEASGALSPRPVVLSSVRDILVASRRDQARHDEQASVVANRWFDGVLVHADPRFARLEESFSPRTPLTVPVHYTGFVDRPRAGGAAGQTDAMARGQVCVSAGGGLVGGRLFRAAVEAAPLLLGDLGLPTTIVTGPLLPAAERTELERAAADRDGCTVVGFVSDLAAEMAASAVSVSQCGYNTSMDILAAGMPAVVVPYSAGREDEQLRRARRLEAIGAVTVLEEAALSVRTLVEAIRQARRAGPAAGIGLRLDGARRTAELVDSMVARDVDAMRAGAR